MPVPFLRTVVLTNPNQNYNLLTLLQALDSTVVKHVQALQLQCDPDGGAAVLRIGNEPLSDTDWGVSLVATQAFSIHSVEANLVRLADVYMRSTVGGLKVGVSMIPR